MYGYDKEENIIEENYKKICKDHSLILSEKDSYIYDSKNRILCNENGKKIRFFIFDKINNTFIDDGRYIFIIRESEPDRIYYYSEINNGSLLQNCNQNIISNNIMFTHLLLAQCDSVWCAGELIIDGYKIKLNNQSGHYRHFHEYLKYGIDLINKINLTRIEKNLEPYDVSFDEEGLTYKPAALSANNLTRSFKQKQHSNKKNYKNIIDINLDKNYYNKIKQHLSKYQTRNYNKIII